VNVQPTGFRLQESEASMFCGMMYPIELAHQGEEFDEVEND
jgi:hypothetical protein